MKYPQSVQPRVLLFTADKDVDSAALSEAVQCARALDSGLTVYITIPIDALDHDVLDDLMPLGSLKTIVERRRMQKIELFVAPYRHLLRHDIEVCVRTGIEFVELIRTRMLGDYDTVFWIRNGDITRLDGDESPYGVSMEEGVTLPRRPSNRQSPGALTY